MGPTLQTLIRAIPGYTAGQGFNQGSLNAPNPELSAGTAALKQGADNGWLNDILGQYESQRAPGIERQYQTGAQDVLSGFSQTGNLTSSGAGQGLVNYRSALDTQFGNELASVFSSAVPSSIGARLGSAQGLLGEGQRQQGLPLQALGLATSAISGAPYNQPAYGPSKGQQALSTGTTLGAAYLSGMGG